MKKLIASMFLLTFLAMPAWSQLLFEENFDYPAGDSLTAHGWTGLGSYTTPLNVSSGSLSYAGYPASGIGNSALCTSGTNLQDVAKPFTTSPIQSGLIYIAFLVRVNLATTDSSNYFLNVMDSSSSNNYGRVTAYNAGSGNIKFGIQRNSGTGALRTLTSSSYSNGSTPSFLIILKYDFSNSTFSLFVNPSLAGTEPTPDAINSTGTAPANNIKRIQLRQGGSTGANVNIDGIRVAQTWSDAIGGGSTANQPPSISGLTRDPWVPSAEAIVGATVTDDHNIVPPVRIIVSTDGVPTDSMDMSSTGSNTYEAEIPVKPNGSYVTYVIRATDDSGAVTITSPQKYFAGITNISTIRVNDGNGLNTYIGTPVKVRGIVTAGDTLFTGFNTDIFIQDATGGINVYKSGLTLYPDGRDLTVEGTINHFNGKLEITTPNITITDNGSGAMPDPLIVAPADAFNEANEGKLMIITGVTFDASGNFATKDSAYTLNGNTGYLAFVDKDNDYLVGQPIPSGTVNLRGIMSQYDNSSPYTSGYQLLPRYVSDLNVVVAVNEPVSHLPKNFSIAQNFPNPFNPSTTIEYTVPKQSDISIKIYNLLGQEIRTLVNGSKAQGRYSVTWDGKDNAGRAVSTGIYFYRLNAPNFVETRKMVMIK